MSYQVLQYAKYISKEVEELKEKIDNLSLLILSQINVHQNVRTPVGELEEMLDLAREMKEDIERRLKNENC